MRKQRLSFARTVKLAKLKAAHIDLDGRYRRKIQHMHDGIYPQWNRQEARI